MPRLPSIHEIMGVANPGLDPSEIRRFLQQAQAKGGPNSRWVKAPPYDIYLRSGGPRRLPDDVGGRLDRPVDLANIARKDDDNVGMERLPPEARPPRGKFRELLAILEELSAQTGHDSVYVENIMNEFLPEVLASSGYQKDPFSPWSAMPSMFKRL